MPLVGPDQRHRDFGRRRQGSRLVMVGITTPRMPAAIGLRPPPRVAPDEAGL